LEIKIKTRQEFLKKPDKKMNVVVKGEFGVGGCGKSGGIVRKR